MKLPRAVLPWVTALTLAACSSADPTPLPSVTHQPSPTPAEASPTPRAGTAAPSAPATPPPTPRPIVADPGTITLQAVTSGLDAPIGFATSPTGGLLVHERGGRVLWLDPASGDTSVVVDLADRIGAGGEQGLLGLTLHPEWPEDTRAFVHYTDRDGASVISVLDAGQTGLPPRLEPGSERVLLRVAQPFANHNGGQLAFGPDGFLYIGLGDGGSGGDPLGNGQDPTTLLGTVLRIDVDGAGAGTGEDGVTYGIPPDNPFADGERGAPEVHLFGLRNPWRFSFDPMTGTLWVADVGQRAWEEIDRLDPVADAGANLGWNVMEGLHCFAVADCSPDDFHLPITEYGHDAGCSVTGGHVYRGDAIPDLWGWYLFADYCSGLVFGVPSDAERPAVGTAVEPQLLLESGVQITGFGVDPAGELYVTDITSGTIYRIVGG